MTDHMSPIPFDQLMRWILTERKSGSVFGVRRPFRPAPGASLELFGARLETPFGPAAGPHTAGETPANLISAARPLKCWLAELLPLTGYVHGGCSPIGMKKQFVTTIDKSAEHFDKIMFSAGKIGYQVEVSLADLKKVIRYQLGDITEE